MNVVDHQRAHRSHGSIILDSRIATQTTRDVHLLGDAILVDADHRIAQHDRTGLASKILAER